MSPISRLTVLAVLLVSSRTSIAVNSVNEKLLGGLLGGGGDTPTTTTTTSTTTSPVKLPTTTMVASIAKPSSTPLPASTASSSPISSAFTTSQATSAARSSSASSASTTTTKTASTSKSSTSTTTVASGLPAASPTTTSVPANYVRGVNIGGWLILEPWLDQVLLNGSNAPDQVTFDQTSNAASALQKHWSTYFTEDDVKVISGFGLNALRIPIGYWSFNSSDTPYVSGAQDYLDLAIGWARKYSLKVLVDVHGSPGSQNGWDHSGDTSQLSWQSGANQSHIGPPMQHNLEILEQVATKYGSSSYADVVFGIEIVNEPICWGPQDFGTTKNWAAAAYNAVVSVATNTNLQVITHDSFMGPQNWCDLGSAINSNLPSSQFAVDVHLYQNMVSGDNSMNVSQHIAKACNWGNAVQSSLLPWYVGEFSAATNICVNPDGSSFGDDGSQHCTQDGCQCTSSVSIDHWGAPMKNATRAYWEAQLQAFEHATSGYFLWNYHGFGAWSLVDLINYGVIGPTINDRMYGKQCNFTA